MERLRFKAYDKELNIIGNVISLDFYDNKEDEVFLYYESLDNFQIRKISKVTLIQYSELNSFDNEEIFEEQVIFNKETEEYYKVIFEEGVFKAINDNNFKYLFEIYKNSKIVDNVFNLDIRRKENIRKLKYRAFDKKTNQIGKVISLNLYKTREKELSLKFDNNIIVSRRFEDVIIMENTCVFSMNNKEIIEGDILFDTYSQKYSLVIFKNGGFFAKCKNDEEVLLSDISSNSKIVGNFYTNNKFY